MNNNQENQKEYTVKMVEKYNQINTTLCLHGIGIGLSVAAIAKYCILGNYPAMDLGFLTLAMNNALLTYNMFKKNGIHKDIKELQEELGLGELENNKGKSR